MSDFMVELHSRECTCRGAMWMLPQGATAQCAGPAGAPPADAIVLTVAHWRALGKPRSIEGHVIALRRASPQLRATLTVVAQDQA
jgi:hypothetical protein